MVVYPTLLLLQAVFQKNALSLRPYGLRNLQNTGVEFVTRRTLRLLARTKQLCSKDTITFGECNLPPIQYLHISFDQRLFPLFQNTGIGNGSMTPRRSKFRCWMMRTAVRLRGMRNMLIMPLGGSLQFSSLGLWLLSRLG